MAPEDWTAELTFRKQLIRAAKRGEPRAIKKLWDIYKCTIIPVDMKEDRP